MSRRQVERSVEAADNPDDSPTWSVRWLPLAKYGRVAFPSVIANERFFSSH